MTIQISERAERLKATSLIIDPASGAIVDPEPEPRNGERYFDRLVGAGFDSVAVTLAAHFDDFDAFAHSAWSYLSLFAARPDDVMQIRTVADIRTARETGRLGVIFGSQTGTIVGSEGWRWDIAHALGLRVSTLTYSEGNMLGDGCNEPTDRGLTAFGRQAVQDMNRLGITVDISHVGGRTAEEVVDWSSKAVIASHSNSQVLCPSLRNLSRPLMHKLAERGGVMGISPFSAMLYREVGVRPTMRDYLDMIDHCVDEIGIEHVGIGTDLYESYTKVVWESKTKRRYPSPWVFETRYAEGFDQIAQFPTVIEGLIDRGYTDAQIEALVGGNWLRVFQETWEPETSANGGWAARTDTYKVEVTV